MSITHCIFLLFITNSTLFIAIITTTTTTTITNTTIGNISGVISERDYVSKIALLGKNSKETPIKEISTKAANLMVAHLNDSVDDCMEKMLSKDIRHLPLVDDNDKVIGMLCVKDLVKSLVKEKERTIKVLSDFALGKGGHFGSD